MSLSLLAIDQTKMIEIIRQKYPDDGRYLFKSCGFEWIVVMIKLIDTITNQSRLQSYDPNRPFANHRANLLMVVDIIHKFNPNMTTDEIHNTFYRDHVIKYTKGSIVVPDSFDPNVNKVRSNGIHFFEKIERAFYFELEEIENGKWNEWYDDGIKRNEGIYLNGRRHGKWTFWFASGQIKEEGEYLNGLMHGKWTSLYVDGKKESEGEYLNGKKNGKWTEWYFSGQKGSEGEYINGDKHGKWTYWYDDGLYSEVEFINE